MRQTITIILAIVMLVVSGPVHDGRSVALAQGDPPELGDVILEDALVAPGLPNVYTCPSGRQKREFANDGFTLTISGGCQPNDEFPGSGINPRGGLTMADGEVRVEFRQLGGLDRTQVQILLRTRNQPVYNGYNATVTPTRGMLDVGVSTDGGYKPLGQKTDLAAILKPDDWNSMAFRAQGSSFWVFVNDQQVLAFSDASLDNGVANVIVRRSGQPNPADTQEVSAVLRNLNVSAIAGGDVARAPVYTPPPPPAVTGASLPCSLPTALPTDAKLTPPAADLDPGIARLAGAWEGTWDNSMAARLYVEQIDAAKATVVQTWADDPGGTFKAGWQRSSADVQPAGKLGWGTTRKYSFWAVDDNTVEGTLETAQFTSKITLNRCPPR
jgi:hypothetical protein